MRHRVGRHRPSALLRLSSAVAIDWTTVHGTHRSGMLAVRATNGAVAEAMVLVRTEGPE